MFFFEGCTCPVCEQVLKQDEDIVVCPKCGAPHHRECYKSNNTCAFEEKHNEGFIWQKDENFTQHAEETPLICIFCGTENPANRLYCSDCNRPLFHSADYSSRSNEQNSGASSANPTAGPFYISGSEITIPDSETIDDVPVGDIKRFVRNTFFYYVPTFYVMARQCKKITLNLAALFLHGIWFISRKMYLLGSFLLTAQLALQCGISYFNAQYINYIEPTLPQTSSEDYSMVLMTSTMEYVTKNPYSAMILIALTVLSYALYAFSGLFANLIYKRTCIKRIKEINASSASVDDFNEKLDAQGGISIIATLIFGIIYFVAVRYIKRMFLM